MKSLKQFIIEASNGWKLPRTDVIDLENSRIDYKEYLKKHFNDKCQVWLCKNSGKISGLWNSIQVMIPYPENYFVEIRLHFNKFPTSLVQVVGHGNDNKINLKVPNELFWKILDNRDVYYYNAIFSDRPERFTDTYAKYL